MAIEFTPSAPIWEVGTEQYFSDYRRQVEEQLRPAVEEEHAAVTVLQEAEGIDVSELPRAAQKVAQIASSIGFEVHPRRSHFRKEALTYKSDSGDNQAGAERSPAWEGRLYGLAGIRTDIRAGFEAFWEGKGLDGISGTFLHARVIDPVGIPFDNWYDYTKNKVDAKRMNLTEAERIALGHETNAELNDDSQRMEKFVTFSKASDFNLWLEDWKAILGGNSTGA